MKTNLELLTRIQNREKDADLIYSVAQQRMWPQRILLLATRLAAPDDAEGVSDSRDKLKSALADMRKSHEVVQLALQDPDIRQSFV